MILKDYACAVTSVLETVLFSGLPYGWPSLLYVLTEEGYFSYLCSENEQKTAFNFTAESQMNRSKLTLNNASTISHLIIPPNSSEVFISTKQCTSQIANLNLVYTITFAISLLCSVLYGNMLDKFGTWVTRTVNIISVIIGLVLFIVSTPATSWILFIAFPALVSGGNSLLGTNVQVGNLFGKAKNSVVSLLTGAVFLSSTVFLLVKTAYENGVALKNSFYFLLLCAFPPLLKTFFLMPKTFLIFPQPKPRQKYGVISEWQIKKSERKSISFQGKGPGKNKRSSSVRGLPTTEKSKNISFKECIKMPIYWTALFSLAFSILRTSFYYGSFNIYMSRLADPEVVNSYRNIFGVMVVLGAIVCPLSGVLADVLNKRFYKVTNNQRLASRKALFVSSFIEVTISIVMSISAAISVLPLQIFTFVAVVTLQGISLTTIIMFLTTMFPIIHFGKLYGVMFLIAGLIVFLQYPLTILGLNVLGGDLTAINIAFIVVCCLRYIHVILLYKHIDSGVQDDALSVPLANPDRTSESQEDQMRRENRRKYLKQYMAGSETAA